MRYKNKKEKGTNVLEIFCVTFERIFQAINCFYHDLKAFFLGGGG